MEDATIAAGADRLGSDLEPDAAAAADDTLGEAKRPEAVLPGTTGARPETAPPYSVEAEAEAVFAADDDAVSINSSLLSEEPELWPVDDPDAGLDSRGSAQAEDEWGDATDILAQEEGASAAVPSDISHSTAANAAATVDPEDTPASAIDALPSTRKPASLAAGVRVCYSCKRTLASTSFTKSQRLKGPASKCVACLEHVHQKCQPALVAGFQTAAGAADVLKTDASAMAASAAGAADAPKTDASAVAAPAAGGADALKTHAPSVAAPDVAPKEAAALGPRREPLPAAGDSGATAAELAAEEMTAVEAPDGGGVVSSQAETVPSESARHAHQLAVSGLRICFECKRTLTSATDFTKSQRLKGAGAKCLDCLESGLRVCFECKRALASSSFARSERLKSQWARCNGCLEHPQGAETRTASSPAVAATEEQLPPADVGAVGKADGDAAGGASGSAAGDACRGADSDPGVGAEGTFNSSVDGIADENADDTTDAAAPAAPPAAGANAGVRACAVCKQLLASTLFTKSQRLKGAQGKCMACVEKVPQPVKRPRDPAAPKREEMGKRHRFERFDHRAHPELGAGMGGARQPALWAQQGGGGVMLAGPGNPYYNLSQFDRRQWKKQRPPSREHTGPNAQSPWQYGGGGRKGTTSAGGLPNHDASSAAPYCAARRPDAGGSFSAVHGPDAASRAAFQHSASSFSGMHEPYSADAFHPCQSHYEYAADAYYAMHDPSGAGPYHVSQGSWGPHHPSAQGWAGRFHL